MIWSIDWKLTKDCEWCGAPISTTPPEHRSSRRFCDQTCRQSAHRERQRARDAR